MEIPLIRGTAALRASDRQTPNRSSKQSFSKIEASPDSEFRKPGRPRFDTCRLTRQLGRALEQNCWTVGRGASA
jgi:hypothetical protein